MCRPVYLELKARATITIMHVGFNPLPRAKVRPVAVSLMSALNRDNPLSVAIV
jgi:hypothetical protein